MKDISTASGLEFFKVERYKYDRYNTFDTSTCPRPHFCMGLVFEGRGSYTDCETGEIISVERGDIIFVPQGSRYISEWHGETEISYISMHFIFDRAETLSNRKEIVLQKVRPDDFEKAQSEFCYALKYYDKDGYEKFAVLGSFYSILSELLPKLRTKPTRKSEELERAVDYIEENYRKKISVEELARIANMSISRFFTVFKKVYGVTPIEYINNYKINRAIILMMRDEKLTVEEISEAVGFESSAYFRRIFKRITGKTPREYKKRSMEM